METVQLTFDDHRRRIGRGGPRAGAGRPREPRPLIYHVRRDPIPRGCPTHVTLRVRPEVGNLRARGFVRAFRKSLRSACERRDFRISHFSLQRDHLHLIAEATDKHALGRGMKSIAARLARLVNRSKKRRGEVLLGRYHVHSLRTPREVRNALAYVLLNARKHWMQRHGCAPPVKLDEASSGAVVQRLDPEVSIAVLSRATAGRVAPYLALARRLAKAWPHRRRRSAGDAMIDHELAQQLYNDGRGAFETGDVARAIHSFQQSAAVFPHFKTLELLGEALLQSGNALAAVAPLAAATALNAQVRAPSLLAEAFLSLGEIEDAREFAADVITRDPGNRRARRVLDAIGAA